MDFVTEFIRDNYFFVSFFIFLFGASVGSFLNVCIYRLPEEGKSIVRPRSQCPSCHTMIRWYDNIPIASYILLKGKCRKCGVRISPQYIIIEALAGYIFVEYFVLLGLTVEYFFYLYLTCSLLVATVVDVRLQIIPDEVNYAGMIVGCVCSLLFPQLHGATTHIQGLLSAFLGLVVGGGMIYLTGLFGDFVFKKESMGGGDVKLMAMIGAFFGWEYTALTFFLAPFLGSVVGLYVKFVRKQEIIPYGPFLSLAALVSLFAGHHIVAFIFKFNIDGLIFK